MAIDTDIRFELLSITVFLKLTYGSMMDVEPAGVYFWTSRLHGASHIMY